MMYFFFTGWYTITVAVVAAIWLLSLLFTLFGLRAGAWWIRVRLPVVIVTSVILALLFIAGLVRVLLTAL